MALYFDYLPLLFTLLFIHETTPQFHDDMSGLKYIVLDEKSNIATFYSSLFKNGKIEQNKLTSLSSRGKRSVESSSFLYSSNSSKTGLATEYEFHGDNHSVAFLHWSGSRSQVIFILTTNYKNIHRNPGGSVQTKSAYLWRSTDYGTSFHREDQIKFNKGTRNINGIHFCKGNNKRVVVYDQKGKWVYISDNEGDSYTSYQVDFTPQEILCTRDSGKNLLVAFDETKSKLYHSKDNGKTWPFICTGVVQYFWGPDSTTLFIEIQQTGRNTSVLKYIKLPGDASNVKVFDASLGGFVTRSFEVNGKYMFVKKVYPQMSLYVSYNGSSFKKAQFPLQLDVKDFNVVDGSEDEVLLCVRHADFYNLYVSDKTGTKYSLSLRRILASSSYRWGHKLKLADIHRLKSLRGVYLANILRRNGFVQTFITFDKGGSWNRLAVPDNVPCTGIECGLNLHMVHSERYYQISSVLSSESALGLVMAQGNVGRFLKDQPDVFLSSDGGLHWKKVLTGRYDFVFGDHGGLIVAVPLRNYTKKVWYSCTEGNFWNTISMKKDVKAYGLVTEPGETTWVSNIFGQHSAKNFEWLSVKLNFSSVFERKCTDQDYTLWTPNDERMKGKCLLGEQMMYERRKTDTCCYNGKEYEREINQTSCNCTLEDFMCDFGFQKSDMISGLCVPISEDLIVPKVCPESQTYMRASGYRKVSGDRCVGGIENQFVPVVTLCPVKVPSGLSIVLKWTTLAAHTPITFNLIQEQGSTGSTWYLWDFGDDSNPINVTGITKAQKQNHTFTNHGSFNVTVTASNSMGTTSTKLVVQAIDAIVNVVITPPHAVLVGQPVPFNTTLFSQHTKLSWVAEHGYVHFVWTFEPNVRPTLTWDNEVEHTFMNSGKYTVKVEAINAISRQYAQVTIYVHDTLRTLRISFDDNLNKETKDTVKWRDKFGNMVMSVLTRILSIPRYRLEVYVLSGLPTQVDVSIKSRDTNNSLTMDQLVEKIKQKIDRRLLVIYFPDGASTKATYAELLDNTGNNRQIVDVGRGQQDTRLAIAIGVAAGFVVVALVGIIFYVYRRYIRIYRRYSRLSMNGSRPDGFIPLHPGGQESVGYNADDNVVRYAVPETENMDDSEDELLIDDVAEPGRLSLVINEDAQQDNSQTNTARA